MDFSAISGRRVLITGGLGFIGSNLALRCVSLGCQVILVTRSLEKEGNIALVNDRVGVELVDMSTADNAVSALRALLPGQDYVFHLAAQTSHLHAMEDPLYDLQVNCGVTLALLEGCRHLCPDAAVVMPGTVTQVGRAARLPVAEEQPDWPLTLYDAHKLTCEKYLYVYHENYGLKTTTLRLANVFGERQQVNNPRRGILNFMLWRAMNGEPLTIYEPGNFVRDYSYVQNVVDAFLAAAVSPRAAGKAYVFGSGSGLEFQQMTAQIVAAVRAVIGVKAEIRRVPFPAAEKKMDVGNFIADNSKLRAETGWYPRVSFSEGVQNTIRFYRERLEESSREQ
jgi:nucleoside-diphosphate-sugar epimerase|tara:strand:- start:174 stop:1187 length:1014 start_codon:yes stop_codon:yes gene_type:complete